MEKIPMQCKLGLTIKCPNWDKPEMVNLFTKLNYNYPLEFDIAAANVLCLDCSSFILSSQKA